MQSYLDEEITNIGYWIPVDGGKDTGKQDN